MKRHNCHYIWLKDHVLIGPLKDFIQQLKKTESHNDLELQEHSCYTQNLCESVYSTTSSAHVLFLELIYVVSVGNVLLRAPYSKKVH
jgi:hypothetical protein